MILFLMIKHCAIHTPLIKNQLLIILIELNNNLYIVRPDKIFYLLIKLRIVTEQK